MKNAENRDIFLIRKWKNRKKNPYTKKIVKVETFWPYVRKSLSMEQKGKKTKKQMN